ncbi:MAG TPA: maleylpyruvate isomerase N-terminal domain-containing protein [Ilumatobacteraceae bacterium]|nr:maleylpyruvate isomerase N-terminal domain-containing protein [Ilumatobacteraceae bacterium]
MATESHRRLLDSLDSLSDEAARTPSLLPGWTVGHVLAHLALNATSQARVLAAGKSDGEPVAQYPGGREGRPQAIEAASGRPAAVLVADLARAYTAVEQSWVLADDAAWAAESMTTRGSRPNATLPYRRLRENEIHRVDLGSAGGDYDWTMMPRDFVAITVRELTRQWSSRRPMGMATLPTEVLALPEPTRLAWLTGRLPLPTTPAANLFE